MQYGERTLRFGARHFMKMRVAQLGPRYLPNMLKSNHNKIETNILFVGRRVLPYLRQTRGYLRGTGGAAIFTAWAQLPHTQPVNKTADSKAKMQLHGVEAHIRAFRRAETELLGA